jgi:hypothetical protein
MVRRRSKLKIALGIFAVVVSAYGIMAYVVLPVLAAQRVTVEFASGPPPAWT